MISVKREFFNNIEVFVRNSQVILAVFLCIVEKERKVFCIFTLFIYKFVAYSIMIEVEKISYG